MNVLMRGLGNIGTTVANVLLAHREVLGVERLAVLKHGPQPFLEEDLALLRERGADVMVGAEELGRALQDAAYVFDCRAAGAPRTDLGAYERLEHLRGACAQGTEQGFGVPFVTGVNDGVVRDRRFVQVASCNTHATASLLRATGGDDLSDLVEADFVVVRRSEDIGSHDRLVSGTVVARHCDPASGTHHAADARRVYATVDLAPAITSADITTPSQLLHTVRFAIRLGSEVAAARAIERLGEDPLIARTSKFDASRLFELGRRYGFQGRLYSHAIVVSNNLLVDGHTVRGWAFVPQEGNTILSTLDAFLLQTGHPERDGVLARMRGSLLRPAW